MLSLIAKVLMTLALAVGALSAATAYMVSLEAPTERLVTDPPLTLGAEAGAVETAEGGVEPIAERGDALTADLVEELDAAGVTRVRVTSFAWSRWPERWWFALSALAIGGGALMLRTASKREIEAARTASEEGTSPLQTVEAMRSEVESLLRDLPGLPDELARNRAILERVGRIEHDHLIPFVDARPVLVARYGLGGFAGVMDRFAAAERQLNRAWSAAADEYYDEAVASLRRAGPLLQQTAERLSTAG